MATTMRKTNWFAIWVSIIAVVVLVGVTVLVVWMNNQASGGTSGPAAQPKGSIINTDAGAVSFGSGSNSVDSYIDFLCPFCNQFEQTEGPDIKKLVDEGKITLNVHPVTILDNNSSPAGYSSRAAGSFYAVAAADPDNAYAYMQALFANQPEEGSAGLTDEQLVDLAKNAGVNVTAELEKAITSNEYQQYALSQQLPSGATGTPTLVVNGNLIPVTMDVQKDVVANLK